MFSLSGKRKTDGKWHRTTIEECAQNICKLDITSVNIVKRQNNGIYPISLELRNICTSFLFIYKYLLVENILSSLVIRGMPEMAISECIITTVKFWVYVDVESTLKAYIFSSEQGGENLITFPAFPRKWNQYDSKFSLQRASYFIQLPSQAT